MSRRIFLKNQRKRDRPQTGAGRVTHLDKSSVPKRMLYLQPLEPENITLLDHRVSCACECVRACVHVCVRMCMCVKRKLSTALLDLCPFHYIPLKPCPCDFVQC